MIKRKFELSNGKVIEAPYYMNNKDGYLYNNNSQMIEALDDDEVTIDENFGKNPEAIITGTVESHSDYQIVGFKDNYSDGTQRGVCMNGNAVSNGAMRIKHNTTIVKEINPPTVYISGAMTGVPKEEYEAHFQKAASELVGKGFIIYNPSGLSVEDTDKSYKEILLEDIKTLSHYDAIYMLKGYKWSAGANAELRCAYAMGLEVMWEDDNEIEVLPGYPNGVAPKYGNLDIIITEESTDNELKIQEIIENND